MYKKIFAFIINATEGMINKIYRKQKEELLSDLKGKILEIGAGTGSNIVFYNKDAKLTLLEPNIEMHKYMEKKEKSFSIVKGSAEDLPFKDKSFDHVVSTLVLCSVADQARALREIKRVLKKNGKFVFIEHVGSKKGSMKRGIQNFINPAWNTIADGCNLNKDTLEEITNVFGSVIATTEYSTGLVSPNIMGYAVNK